MATKKIELLLAVFITLSYLQSFESRLLGYFADDTIVEVPCWVYAGTWKCSDNTNFPDNGDCAQTGTCIGGDCNITYTRWKVGNWNALYNLADLREGYPPWQVGYRIANIVPVICFWYYVCDSECIPIGSFDYCTNSPWIPPIPWGGFQIMLSEFQCWN